jgi:hypothetical protein
MENSMGTDIISVVSFRVLKQALCAALFAGILIFSGHSVRADNFDPIFGFYRPELFTTVDGSGLLQQLPITEYLNGVVPGSTSLGKMGTAPVGNLPTALVSTVPRPKKSSVSGPVRDPKDGKDYSSAEALATEKASLTWTGGEVGFMYGHASGRFGGDEFSSYILGGVGNDHLQINVGAGYEETHFSRGHH